MSAHGDLIVSVSGIRGVVGEPVVPCPRAPDRPGCEESAERSVRGLPGGSDEIRQQGLRDRYRDAPAWTCLRAKGVGQVGELSDDPISGGNDQHSGQPPVHPFGLHRGQLRDGGGYI